MAVQAVQAVVDKEAKWTGGRDAKCDSAGCPDWTLAVTVALPKCDHGSSSLPHRSFRYAPSASPDHRHDELTDGMLETKQANELLSRQRR